MTRTELAETTANIENFALKNPFHERVGELFLDTDNNIVYIISNKGARFLTGFEYNELMNPTKECAQLVARKEIEKLNTENIIILNKE